MSNLTAEQVIHMAKILNNIANGFAGYVFTHQNTLDRAQKEQLVANQLQITTIADHLLNHAAELIFTDIDQQLTAMDSINSAIDHKLKELTDLQKMISISTDVLLLAKAISTVNLKEIVKSTADLLDALKH